MVIRDAREQDIEEIAALHVANQKSTYRGLLSDEYLDRLSAADKAEQWRAYLRHDGNRLFVACDESVFLGFAACKTDAEIPGCLYLDSLHVSPEARGSGIGTSLIRRVGSFAEENGFDSMSVCIVRGNEGARRLYLKLGASHDKFFTDYFDGATSRSEKLRWTDLSWFTDE